MRGWRTLSLQARQLLAASLAQLGRFEEARRRLALAFEIDSSYRAEAETDPDLKPLREAGGWA